MSFWTMLGDLGATVAAPFTGGASLAALPVINALGNEGQVAGAAAQQGANGLVQQAQLGQGQDKNALQLYQEQLQAAKDKLAGSTTLANQAVRGDTMANAKDATISGLPPGVTMPTITGGLRPSLLGPNSQAAGGALSKNALMQLLNGGPTMPTAPTMTPLPQASGLQQTLAGVGLGGSLVGGLAPLFQNNNGTQNPTAPGGIQIPGNEFDPNMIYGAN